MATIKAFLSHSSKDNDLVEKVANALCRRGIIPWIDKDNLLPGGSIIEKLKEAIKKQAAIVLFLSEHAVDSVWVRDELQEAIRLEDDDNNKDWIIPVFLGDQKKLVSKFDLLADRWLSFDRERVDRLGCIGIPDSKNLSQKSLVEKIVKQLSQSLYKLLNVHKAQEINIVVDQRGNGRRIGEYELSQNISRLSRPTLVFRPDKGERQIDETLVGDDWNSFRQAIKDSLTNSLGRLKRGMKISILGDGQLGLAFFLGKTFDRTSCVSLFCYNERHGTVFSNEKQNFYSPLTGGNKHCETTYGDEKNGNQLFPAKINSNERYSTVALYIGSRTYLLDVIKHVKSTRKKLPLIFVETQKFEDSKMVMEFIKNVVALLFRLREQNETNTIRFYCGLPFNVVPLLASNLIHVIDNNEFIEYRRDLKSRSGSIKDMYTHLPME